MMSKAKQIVGLSLLGGLSLSGLVFGGCTSQPDPAELPSLRRSGEATFLCLGPNGEGAPLIDCPRGRRTDDDGFTVAKPGYELHALVTQTLSAEVAVVRITGYDSDFDANGKVLDVDQSNPGVTPLRVGGQPVDVVSTPGGRASFVSVADVGREGVFALPTNCILAPGPDEPRRDLTTWPACSLPSRPGHMQLLIDPLEDRGPWCGAAPSTDNPYAEPDAACRVDLSLENQSPGRRKLLIAMPDESKIIVLDAQELLDREQGTFAPCHIEAELPLEAVVPGDVVQAVPEELVGPDEGPAKTYPDIAGTYVARPAAMAALDGRLLIADRGSPVIHSIDARDPCQLTPLAPLIATSFEDPSRVVTTSRVAISPLSPTGARYVYAVDEFGDELASVIPFDISPTSSGRTPIVRSGSALNPFEAPDRIEFSAPVKDVAFALLERPEADAATGEAISGTLCNPDPSISDTSIEALYRPTSDTSGARPAALRGLFGYALLSDGRLSLIDIEDFDRECRRPKSLNATGTMDFRGCVNDKPIADYLTDDGTLTGVPTVTDEASCRVVVPHRARSGSYVRTTDEVRAPSMRAFGQLSYQSRGLTVSRQTTEGRKHPILLPVDFEGPQGPVPAQVYVGNTFYERYLSDDPLIINPNLAERIVPTLPFIEPRAYPSSQIATVTYEGALDSEHEDGELTLLSDEVAQFDDEAGGFCDKGVQDERLISEVGVERFGLTGESLANFVERHVDYLQITNLLFNSEDPYWDNDGASCGESGNFDGTGYTLCDSVFGLGDEDDLNPARDLTIISAYQDSLEVTPRALQGSRAKDRLELAQCCFSENISYRLRAGNQWTVVGAATGFQHQIIADESDDDRRCIRDESPLKAHLNGRAFEVSSNQCYDTNLETTSCGVGLRTQEDLVCFYNGNPPGPIDSSVSAGEQLGGPVEVDGPASECIFDSLTSRFVVYRGLEPSLRGMSFGYEVAGGFRAQAISLTRDSTIVLPVSLSPIPDFNAMGVVDSQNQGLMMIDLPNSRIGYSYY